MPRSNERLPVRALGAVLAIGVVLSGCSDLYFDRRETIAFGSGDAVAANATVQTIDPSPRGSDRRDFSTNGPRMAGAIERYRTGKIIQPQGTGTSSTGFGSAPALGQGGAPTGVAAPNN